MKFTVGVCICSGSGSIDIPVLCMLVSGDSSMLEVQSRVSCWLIDVIGCKIKKSRIILLFLLFRKRVDLSLKNSMPWLVLAGSGGLADFLSDVLEHLSSVLVVQSSSEGDSEAGPSVDLKDRVAEWVKKHFPSEAEPDKLVEWVSAVQ